MRKLILLGLVLVFMSAFAPIPKNIVPFPYVVREKPCAEIIFKAPQGTYGQCNLTSVYTYENWMKPGEYIHKAYYSCPLENKEIECRDDSPVNPIPPQ